MCGIAGYVRLDGSPASPDAVRRMTDALSHRGPNGDGVHCHENVGLGHRRLSILDLSASAAQPMRSADGAVVLSFNGEIYNFQEERVRLQAKGYTFSSTGDTEVLLKMYEDEGEACVQRLRGMFAFAILDTKRQVLFLVRDRVGKKPLKYFVNNGVFAFASELKALRTMPECPKDIDWETAHHFLTMMYVPSPRTGISGIHKVPAAHTLTLDLKTGEYRIKRYWSLTYGPKEGDASRSIDSWKDEVRSVFEQSVKLRMVADVHVGAFLSGGVDSAAVVAFMSKLSDRPVKTFSVGTDDPSFNELPQAALSAKAFGTDHTPIVVKPDIVTLLPQLVASYEEPYADPSSIPTYLISRETSKHVTVALNGDGGDENFAGYARYPILLFSQRWAKVPGFLHALARIGTDVFHAVRRDTLSYRARRFEYSIHLPWEQRYVQYLSFFTEEEKRGLYQPGFGAKFARTDSWYADLTAPARSRAGDTLHQAMSMDVDTYLADDLLPKVDIGTMAFGLEARSPFLDHHLLELTARLPSDLQIRGKVRKWLLKEMLKGMVPDEVLFKRKTGFRLPLNTWFRGELKDFVAARLLGSDQPLFWTMFDRAKLEAFLQEYHASNIDYSDHLWALLWLEEWMRQYA